MWLVYILECSDGTFYTGVTNNIHHRLACHNEGNGAKYTRSRRPCTLIYFEEYPTESKARKREYAIKKLKRFQKEILVEGFSKATLQNILKSE
ncbi:MAG: GIY-YIG nuclease family protein [FCB group bacterium]|nr:GIY-YIG nuclease family protein [FCB group bacterium]